MCRSRSRTLVNASLPPPLLVSLSPSLSPQIFPKNVKQRVVKAQMDKALPQDEAHGDVEGVLRSNRSSLEPAKGRGFLPLLLAPRGAARGARPSASSPLAPATLGPAIADYYPSSTVLFSDIVGFTAWSATVQPETVFHLLEVMFFEFDRLADKLNVYKVRHISAISVYIYFPCMCMCSTLISETLHNFQKTKSFAIVPVCLFVSRWRPSATPTCA